MEDGTASKFGGRSLRRLRVAYTPDSDDAFNYYAWEHGRVTLEGFEPRFDRDHVIALNRAAKLGTYDVIGVSSVHYPALADQYAILAVGNSVGRGYGPVLVSRHFHTFDDLRGKRIAVGGIPTTGGALAMMYCHRSHFHEMQYDKIADAVAVGEFDAGVMIHEELLFFPQKGLHAVADLGKTWSEDTGLPLPVGLNLVRRDLGREIGRSIAGVCRRSLEWGLGHFDEAFAFASKFGRGCARDHVRMFSNSDTVCLPGDVRKAIRLMCDRVAAMGLMPHVKDIEIIDEPPSPSTAAGSYFDSFLAGRLGRPLVSDLHRLSARFSVMLREPLRRRWSLEVHQGVLHGVRQDDVPSQCQFSVDVPTFLSIVAGQLPPQQAFFKRKVEIQGDMAIGLKVAGVMAEFFRSSPFIPATE